MENRTEPVVRELFRLFLVYEAIDQRAAAGVLAPAELAELAEVLRQVSFVTWKRAFGPALDSPQHRRFVLAWCLRNAELLMKEQVLPVIAHHVFASHLEQQMAELAHDTSYDFSTLGPAGSAGIALRRIHLIQTLTIQIEELAEEGQLPAKLRAQLRRLMIRRVKALFRQELPEHAESEGPLQNGQTLDAAKSAGALTADACERFRKALGLGPRLNDSSSGHAIPIANPNIAELAASAELLRRLRRLPSLEPAERDRLIRMVEGEVEALMDPATAKALNRPLAAIAQRLGVPVPPPVNPSMAGGIAAPPSRAGSASGGATPQPPARPRRAPGSGEKPKDVDSSDFQWAFDLIDELRREGVEGGSSGK